MTFSDGDADADDAHCVLAVLMPADAAGRVLGANVEPRAREVHLGLVFKGPADFKVSVQGRGGRGRRSRSIGRSVDRSIGRSFVRVSVPSFAFVVVVLLVSVIFVSWSVDSE